MRSDVFLEGQSHHLKRTGKCQKQVKQHEKRKHVDEKKNGPLSIDLRLRVPENTTNGTNPIQVNVITCRQRKEKQQELTCTLQHK
jgi:hypothetical protein